MRILFLSSWFPYPPDNGSKLRVHDLLRALAHSHDVTLLSFANGATIAPAPAALRALCRDVEVVPWRAFDPHSWRARRGLLSFAPRSIVDTFSPEMARRIEATLIRRRPDVVIAQALTMASYGSHLGGLPALFDEAEVAVPYERFAKAPSAASRVRHGLTWLKQRSYMVRLLRCFHCCTVTSERERQLLSAAVPGYHAIEVIPNCIRPDHYTGIDETPRPDTLIFTGSLAYSANHDAMRWFLHAIYPRIRSAWPAARLAITGDCAGAALPHTDAMVLTGYLADVRPAIASAWLSVVPMRIGGGTRLKILEAMALGTPVVATAKGAEGLDVEDGTHLLLADEPAAFAAQVVRLLSAPALRAALARNARRLVHERYNWQVTGPRFERLVASLGDHVFAGV